jgi:hypothetical protein
VADFDALHSRGEYGRARFRLAGAQW